jgi:TolA-binding protein
MTRRDFLSAQRQAETLMLSKAPPSIRASALLLAADAAYGMQMYPVAASRYREYLASHRGMPDSAHAAAMLGWAELRAGQRDQARMAWLDFVDAYPDDMRAPMMLVLAADLSSRSGDQAATQALLNRIITQYPTSSYAGIARLTRASIAMREQQESEALRDLEEVVRTSGPMAIETRGKLGEALTVPGTEDRLEATLPTVGNSSDGGGALERFTTPLLDRAHREPEPYILHGLVLMTAADRGWDDALTTGLASRLIEDFPTYPPSATVITRVATAAATAGHWPVVRRVWETLAARAPASMTGSARVGFAESLFRTGAPVEARVIAETTAAGGGDEARRALLLLAEIHQSVGERRAALTVYERLLQEHPQADRTPASLLVHLRLLDEFGPAERARPVLRRLVEVSKGEAAAAAAYRLAESLRTDGEAAAAVEWYLTASYLAEDSRWARLALLGAGASLTALDEKNEALAIYRKLLPARPGIDPPVDREASGEAAYRIAEILADAGVHEDALRMFETSAFYTTGLPAERRALVGVLRCLVATGDRTGAEAIYGRLTASGAAEPDLLAQARTALRANGAPHGNSNGNGGPAQNYPLTSPGSLTGPSQPSPDR